MPLKRDEDTTQSCLDASMGHTARPPGLVQSAPRRPPPPPGPGRLFPDAFGPPSGQAFFSRNCRLDPLPRSGEVEGRRLIQLSVEQTWMLPAMFVTSDSWLPRLLFKKAA